MRTVHTDMVIIFQTDGRPKAKGLMFNWKPKLSLFIR